VAVEADRRWGDRYCHYHHESTGAADGLEYRTFQDPRIEASRDARAFAFPGVCRSGLGSPSREIEDALAKGKGGGEEGWRLRKDGSRFCAIRELSPIVDKSD
jgi:hypothetical protein